MAFTLSANPALRKPSSRVGRMSVGDVLSIPFDGEARIEAKGFGDERLRLVYLAQKRIGGGEVGVVPVGVIAGVDRLSVFDDCRFGTTSANFYIAELRVIKRREWITQARSNRLLHVRFRLVETAQGNFRHRSRHIQTRIVRINGAEPQASAAPICS